MADVVDLDSLNDEDFMEALEQASMEPRSDNDVGSSPEPEMVEEVFEDTAQVEEENEEADEEAETNDLNDDDNQETEETLEAGSDEATEENAQVDDDGQGEADASADDGTDTNGSDDEKSLDTDEVDYKKQYEELLQNSSQLQSFYDDITSDIIVSGKKTKGFSDPKMIKQAQQMAGNYSEKMRGIKAYRPFMDPLKKRGMLEDPKKFDLAMQLLDGDTEAIKKHVKDLEIDPFEFDMENINYVPKNQTSSNIEIAYNDMMDEATKYGVDSKVVDVLQKQWDDDSVIELLEDPQSSADLVQHMNNGVYDAVQSRIAEKMRVDVNGVFGNKSTIQQYRESAGEIENEYKQYVYNQMQQQEQQAQAGSGLDEQQVAENTAQIEQERKEADYQTKVGKENKKADDARRKATSVSKKKAKVQTKKTVEDPSDLSDEDFTNILDAFMYDNK